MPSYATASHSHTGDEPGGTMSTVPEDHRQRVTGAIDELRPDLVDFVSDLVSERSVRGNEAGAQALVRTKLETMGWDVDELSATDVDVRDHPEVPDIDQSYEGRPNVVAERTSQGDGRSLLLNGHVDVVPEGDSDQWRFDPFGGEVEDGRVLGRGASDMKGGVGAMLTALEALDTAGI